MELSTFPTFLAFLTQALRSPAPASDPPARPRPTLPTPRAPWTADRGPEGDDVSRRSESECAASSLCPPSTRNSDRSASASVAHAAPFLAEGT
jgi:hypothetical protein